MKNIISKINDLAQKIRRPIVLMELCGTHTEAVARHGIKKLLPKNIKLLSGPGCPVCVTDQRDINAVITMAMEGIPIACYGDVLRVPGTIKTPQIVVARIRPLAETKQSRAMCNNRGMVQLDSPQVAIYSEQDRRAPRLSGARNDSIINLSLDKARELGADVTEVYSVEDALKLQKFKPNLVFFGLGFETTTPMTASAIKRGLMVYSSHKAFVPAMAALLATPQLKIDGFINPGHVSAIIGIEPYKKLICATSVVARIRLLAETKQSRAMCNNRGMVQLDSPQVAIYPEQDRRAPRLSEVRNDNAIPQVIAGFKADDILFTIYMLLKQIAENRAEVENEYARLVKPKGNLRAMELINEVFKIGDAYWRGIGKIPNSGFDIRKKYAEFDAKVKYKNILKECHPERSEGSLANARKSRTFVRDSSGLHPQNDINTGCICGAILRGLKEPQDCKLFNKKCTPDNPIGACMVSSEGVCGIEAKYKN